MSASPSPAVIDRLGELIAFDTVSRNSNVACIDWARAHLEAAGATCRLDWNDDRSKVNLFATFAAADGELKSGGFVLSGHVDVVPVDGQAWSSDPFRAEIRDGRLYGRGACDMKGFDAVVIAAAPLIGRTALARPLHVALTYDEERGCLGIPNLIADLARAGIRPAGAIIGEPSSMRLVAAHKGGEVWRCRVTGKAAHSSQTPSAVNAIEIAAELIANLRALAAKHRDIGPYEAGFVVPHSTISTNLVSGGNGPNIVPAEAEFLFDCRVIPGVDPASIIGAVKARATELEPDMKRVAPETGITFERINAIPALSARPEHEVFQIVAALLAEPSPLKVDYGTEASFFQAYGTPAVVCGPGSIDQAHKADEFVPLADLAACERFIAGLVGRLSARSVA